MSLNLHSEVRGAINTVNPDEDATYLASTGSTSTADYSRVPAYAAPVTVKIQVQALTGKDLEHRDMLNIQGVKRAIYLWGNIQGVVRPDVKGGDLLKFPQVLGGIVQTWLVVVVFETWTPDVLGFCKLGVVLQVDP